MRDKVILGVTLSIVTLLTLVIYGFIDGPRGVTEVATQREDAIVSGKFLYAQYCVQCHGPQGEGCIGPALSRTIWRPEIGGEANENYDDAAHDFIYNTLVRGRPANQPGIVMPPWSIRENGPLNDEQLEDLTAFIQYGDWNKVIEDAASATDLAADLPMYPGFTDKARIGKVKELLLAKGCLNCHALGKGGGRIGADLTDVGSRRTADWLRKWIKDPKSVPPNERGPNLWLVGATATVPAPAGVPANLTPAPTPQVFQMNTTYMPTVPMTEEELNLMVEYLSKARTSTR
ncbi:MAG: c-type cytochrome [Chloroflexia bacterium]